MIDIIYYIFYSFLIASFSYVYIIILLDQDMVLGGLYSALKDILDTTKFGRWIAKPLIDCIYCNAGQLSLWLYLLIYWDYSYNFMMHVGFITLTILISRILMKTLGKF